MKYKEITFTIAFLLFAMTSCIQSLFCIRGNGTIAEDRRNTETFHRITNSTSIDVICKVSDTSGIIIRAEENLIDYIETEVVNNNLEIKISRNVVCLSFGERPVITVSSPALEEVTLSGSGNFFLQKLFGEDVMIRLSGSGDIAADTIFCTSLTATLSGSGDINCKKSDCTSAIIFNSGSGDISIKGNGDNGQFKVSGSGSIYGDNFPVASAGITISGSGDVFTHIIDQLNAIITGSGNIYLRGDPDIHQNITGSGRIIHYKK